MIKNYDIIVNFSKNKIISEKIVLTKDDNLSTQLSFTFEDNIPDGQNIKLTFSNPNNVIYDQLLQVVNKKATYLVPNTLLAVNGYGTMSFTYINGEEIYTNSSKIEPIDIRNNLGEGIDPIPEDISLMGQVISQLNAEIVIVQAATTNADTKSTYAQTQGDYALTQGNYAKTEGDYAKDTGDTYVDSLNNKVDKIIGKGLSTNDYTTDEKNKVSNLPVDTNTILSLKADLENGKIVASQLPSFVDDVINGYYHDSKFYEEDTFITEIIGETGKIYISNDTNITYRWSGIVFVEVSSSLALGETSSTAYRGDLGKVAYEHSQATGNPHGLTASDLEALTQVNHDDSLVGDGTVANPLKLNEEDLGTFAEYQNRVNAGTLLANKFYYWGE